MPLLSRVNERCRPEYFCSPTQRFLPTLGHLASRIDPPQSGLAHDRKIYLARRSTLHRKLINCAEIETIVDESGFDIVYPEDLSFGEQVKLVRSARYVLGPDGSALFLLFLARPGTRAAFLCHEDIVEYPPMTAVIEAVGCDVPWSPVLTPACTKSGDKCQTTRSQPTPSGPSCGVGSPRVPLREKPNP